jgi:hypothetical protein
MIMDSSQNKSLASPYKKESAGFKGLTNIHGQICKGIMSISSCLFSISNLVDT